MAGNDITALIEAIYKLDRFNLAKIALGFSELVTICNRYNVESGHWEDFQEKYRLS